jgi:2-polyprenyl-3-methyl-5-hydroxy-6-metoxy-1,4-benzoquinol methylase
MDARSMARRKDEPVTDRCPLCQSPRIATVMTRPFAPATQQMLCRSEAAAFAVPTATIALAVCSDCGFVFNRAFDARLSVYDTEYENDQSHAPAFLAHMDAMADRVLAAARPGASVVEVGCGQGLFLDRLALRGEGRGLVLKGMDPSYRGRAPAGVTILPQLLTESSFGELGIAPDILISRHVIEHIASPVDFLAVIRRAIGSRNGVRLFVETPSFDWIVQNHVLQDIFYEHVNYFTAATLAHALTAAGFVPLNIGPVFGEQYVWAESIASAPRTLPRSCDDDAIFHRVQSYADSIEADIARMRVLAEAAPSALWGAGAKGVTFAALVDPERTRIACLIDINPRKQGTFVPGTGHAVVSPADAKRRGVKRVIVMNPNYRKEIQALLAAEHWQAELVNGGGSPHS